MAITNLGKINLATQNAHVSGCVSRVLIAKTSQDLDFHINSWFEKNPQVLVVDWKPISDKSVMFILAQVLSDEEIKERDEYAREVQALIEKRRQVERIAATELAIKEEKAREEEKELIALGRKCRQNHSKDFKAKAKETKEVESKDLPFGTTDG